MHSQQYQISREERILEYIKSNPGTTKTAVIRYMENNKYCSIKTTHDIIMKLIDDKKVIFRKDENNSQIHHLIINEQNTFIKIHKQLSNADSFIRKKNQYLYKLFEEIRNNSAKLHKQNEDEQKEDEIKHQERILHVQRNATRHTELIYTTIVSRILEDLAIITIKANLPEEESKAFLTKIVELKSKVAPDYYKWDREKERIFLNSQIREIKQWEKAMKSQRVLEDYAEKKGIEIKLLGPLEEMTNHFIKEFLT